MRDGGKGDTPRPLVIPLEEFDKNFDAIFGTAKRLVKNIKEVNAEFDKTYEGWSKNLEPIPFAGMVDMDEKGEDDA